MRKAWFLFLFLISIVSNLFATQADIQNISSEKYFDQTLNEINSAKSSIFVVMYLVSILPDQPNSQPNQLMNALIRAKDRGVEVKVILDQNINFEAESSEDAVTSLTLPPKLKPLESRISRVYNTKRRLYPCHANVIPRIRYLLF